MFTAYLGLGSNSDDAGEMLCRARILINIYTGRIKDKSNIYITSPWGYQNQNDFKNQVVSITTNQEVDLFYQSVLKVETILKKRKTGTKFGPRNIDIDILLYEDKIVDTDDLKIPHPRMHERNFVLIPLAEIAPTSWHPIFRKKTEKLLTECKDTGIVKIQETRS